VAARARRQLFAAGHARLRKQSPQRPEPILQRNGRRPPHAGDVVAPGGTSRNRNALVFGQPLVSDHAVSQATTGPLIARGREMTSHLPSRSVETRRTPHVRRPGLNKGV
jgi:hypothetical protein